MPVQRTFVDWRAPLLPAAVRYLADRFTAGDALDLGAVLVVVPGSDAQGRLLELLVEHAESSHLVFTPPEMLTLGKLPEKLYAPQKPFAEADTQSCAWVAALRGLDRERLRSLVAQPPPAEEWLAWLPLGQMLARLHVELAADGLDFADVAARGSEVPGFAEQPRWQLLAAVQRRYLDTLDQLRLWDRQSARLFAIKHREFRTPGPIVLVGLVDMNRAQQQMLEQVAEQVTALVHAPEALAERFDALGCLVPAAWHDVPLALSDEQIEVVGGPNEQADAVIRALSRLGEAYSAAEVNIGVPDETLVPIIAQRLAEYGVRSRHVAGTRLPDSGLYRLLGAIAELLESPTPSPWAALVRLPAIARWLAGWDVGGDWLTALDEYQCGHLPANVERGWLAGLDASSPLLAVDQHVHDLLRGLRGMRRPVSEWATEIRAVVANVYGGRPLRESDPTERATILAAEALQAVLSGWDAVPAELAPRLTGAEALRLVLDRLADEAIPPRADPEAVELLGWLELPAGDAPALIVTGFNEGIVPSSRNADLFLPNALRRHLRLNDNERRFARDVYALEVLTHARRALHVIAGRRDAAGDPLVPSRLLFATDRETMARRTRAFLHRAAAPAPRLQWPAGLRPGCSEPDFRIPRPRPLPAPVTSLRVTEFRAYLACKYRYYLEHRLRLRSVTDEVAELDAAKFGELIHDVLKQFGDDEPMRDATDADAIRAFLDDRLDTLAPRAFGEPRLPAVAVQIEQARRRLHRFAAWQAGWRQQGWRILHTERDVPRDQCPFAVDEGIVHIHGRMDRIDQHEHGGHVVFDYKTGDGGTPPDKVHRAHGAWVDLQLPLYRYLAAHLGLSGRVELAYILLPKDPGKDPFAPATWSPEELAEADETARTVVRGIWRQDFWPPADPPPPFSETWSAICQDSRLGSVLAALANAEEEA